MHRTLRLIALLAAVAPALAVQAAEAQGAREVIAVLEVKNDLPAAQQGALGDRARYSEAVRLAIAEALPSAKVMSRAEMQEVASANPGMLDRCNDDDCQALGKLLGADAVIQEVSKSDAGQLVLALRLVDTRTGQTIASRTARARTGDALVAAVRLAASALVADRIAAQSGAANANRR